MAKETTVAMTETERVLTNGQLGDMAGFLGVQMSTLLDVCPDKGADVHEVGAFLYTVIALAQGQGKGVDLHSLSKDMVRKSKVRQMVKAYHTDGTDPDIERHLGIPKAQLVGTDTEEGGICVALYRVLAQEHKCSRYR